MTSNLSMEDGFNFPSSSKTQDLANPFTSHLQNQEYFTGLDSFSLPESDSFSSFSFSESSSSSFSESSISSSFSFSEPSSSSSESSISSSCISPTTTCSSTIMNGIDYSFPTASIENCLDFGLGFDSIDSTSRISLLLPSTFFPTQEENILYSINDNTLFHSTPAISNGNYFENPLETDSIFLPLQQTFLPSPYQEEAQSFAPMIQSHPYPPTPCLSSSPSSSVSTTSSSSSPFTSSLPLCLSPRTIFGLHFAPEFPFSFDVSNVFTSISTTTPNPTPSPISPAFPIPFPVSSNDDSNSTPSVLLPSPPPPSETTTSTFDPIIDLSIHQLETLNWSSIVSFSQTKPNHGSGSGNPWFYLTPPSPTLQQQQQPCKKKFKPNPSSLSKRCISR